MDCDWLSCPCIPDIDAQAPTVHGFCQFVPGQRVCVQIGLKKWSGIPGCWNVLGHETSLRHSAVMAMTEDKQSLCCGYFLKSGVESVPLKETLCRFPSPCQCLALKCLQLRLDFLGSHPLSCKTVWTHPPTQWHPHTLFLQCNINESRPQWCFTAVHWKVTPVKSKSLEWNFLTSIQFLHPT